MLVSKKWLNEMVDVSHLSASELAEILTKAGLEVESVTPLVVDTNLIVGEVIECVDHPDSDHLHVCQVNTGKQVKQIVCGAANVAKGQKVIVALEGTQLPGLMIKATTIRGVDSFGMICSYQELGISEKYLTAEQQVGIAVLDPSLEVGLDALEAIGFKDDILDIKQTPNRNDFMAYYAIAYEVGALLNKPVTLPQASDIVEVSPTPLVIGSTTNNCTQFLGKIVESVTIQQSIPWMKAKLIAAGIKPINNLVDISNIVMLETGQPLHFYDRKQITNDEITVKQEKQETFVALDDQAYDILPQDLCITSNDQVIGLAGIMGGQNSKIHDDTTSLIIEIASFDPISIRQTAKRFNLLTDAATRFIKGIDPLAPQKAMARAVSLIKEYANGSGFHPTVALSEATVEPKQVTVTLTQINELLGLELQPTAIMDVFTRLSFHPVYKEGVFTCTIPSYRLDISIAADLIEEVIRVIGYDQLPQDELSLKQTAGKLDIKQQTRRFIQQQLTSKGLQEVITYTLVHPNQQAGLMALANPVVIASPLSEDRKMVRNQLLPSLLQAIAYNQAHKNQQVNIFEISSVYGHEKEALRLCIGLSESLMSNPVSKQEIQADFYSLKGLIIGLCIKLGIKEARISVIPIAEKQETFHPGKSAQLLIDKKPVGFLGLIHPLLAKQKEIKQVWAAEIDLDIILGLKKAKIAYEPLVKFPVVTRDLAMVVSQDVLAQQVIDVIVQTGKNMIEKAEIFDVFVSDSLGANNKSVATTITFKANQTYVEATIKDMMEQIIDALSDKLGATIR